MKWLVFLMVFGWTGLCRAQATDGVLQAGFARVAINPEVADTWQDSNSNGSYDEGEPWQDGNGNGQFDRDVYLAGFAKNRIAAGVAGDLWAIASVWQQHGRRLALVVVDTIGLMHDERLDLQAALPKDLKIDYLVTLATHNHEAPDTQGLWGPSDFTSGIDPAYLRRIKQAMIKAITVAVKSLEPVDLFRAALSSAGVHPPLIQDVRSPTVVDHGIKVMMFQSRSSGRIIGSLVNWGNHPESLERLNLQSHPDYPGYLRDGLTEGIKVDGEKLAGLGGVHLFTVGSIGGLMTTKAAAPIKDPSSEKIFIKPGLQKTRSVGQSVAGIILKAWHEGGFHREINPQLSWRSQPLLLPLANHGFRLLKLLGTIRRSMPWFMWMHSEMVYIRLGGSGLMSMPGELYPELALGESIRLPGGDYPDAPLSKGLFHEMPDSMPVILGMANDALGYIIPKSQWDTQPPWTTGDRPPYGEIVSVGPETAPLIYESALKLISRLK